MHVPNMKQKLFSVTLITTAVILSFFLFDRGLLSLISPILFFVGIYLSFLIVKKDRGWKKATIPIVLWVLAIVINRLSGSYELYSEYDFIDPINGFILSSIFVLGAFCLTIYYFLRKNPRSKY